MTYGAAAYAAGEYAGPAAAPIVPSATDRPLVSVEVAFTTNPGDVPTWTPVTDAKEVLRAFRVNRGRQNELDRFQAGRATITLANEDRRFDPTYTAGPYYPNVVPMRRIRILATYGGVTYAVFSGFVDSWEQQYLPPQEAVCIIQATDAFKVLGNAELLTSAYAEEVQSAAPSLWWRFGEPSDATMAVEAVTGTRPLARLGTPTFGATSLNVFDPDAAVQFDQSTDGLQGVFPQGTFPLTTEGSLEFIYRSDKTPTPDNPQLAVAALGTTVSGIQSEAIAQSVAFDILNNAGGVFNVRALGSILDNLAHHVVVTWAAGKPSKIYVDGFDATTSTSTFTGSMANTTSKWVTLLNVFDYPPYPYVQGDPATYDEFAIYTRELSAAEVARHAGLVRTPWSGDKTGARIGRLLDALPWPTADRAIDTGVSTLSSAVVGGTLLSAMQKVEETEQGALFMSKDGAVRFVARDKLVSGANYGTFGDSDPELEYADLAYVYDDQLLFNDVQVTREDGITQVVGDATSQARYLRRSKVFDGVLYTTDAEARGLAEWWLDHYKDPVLRAVNMKLEPSAGNSTTHYPHVLGRELLDRVTVRRRPQNLGSAIDQDVMVEGISHDVTADEWVTTWNLSPALAQIYWLAEIVGRGEAGVNTYAGF